MRNRLILALACAASFAAHAQESPATMLPDIDPPGTDDKVPELDAVRVTAPRFLPPDPLDFRNPVTVEDNAFSRSWKETPSLEDIGLQGGAVNLAIQYALTKTAQGIRKIPGWKDPIQHAIARPPPELDAAQRRRAARLMDADGASGDDPPR